MTNSQKAVELVNPTRQGDYGHPADDFTRSTGALSSLGFRFKKADGTYRDLKATDLPIIMACVKLSREVHKHKDDNIVDIHGYMNCLEMILAKEKDEYCSKPLSMDDKLEELLRLR